jgi:hypothetical protein
MSVGGGVMGCGSGAASRSPDATAGAEDAGATQGPAFPGEGGVADGSSEATFDATAGDVSFDVTGPDSGSPATGDAMVTDAADAVAPRCEAASDLLCSGGCVDTQTDNANCGGCGVACGGTCTSGRCVQIVLLNVTTPTGVAVDSTSVYVTSGGVLFSGMVWKVGTDGSNPRVLAQGESYPMGIAVNSQSVYWADNDESHVKSVAIDGGTVQLVAYGNDVFCDVVLSPTNVYVLGQSVGLVHDIIMSAPLDGGPPTSLVRGIGGQSVSNAGPYGIAVDSTNVYWGDPWDAAVRQMPLGGGPVTTIATGQQGVGGIAVDSNGIYWTDSVAGTVMRAPLDAGPFAPIASWQGPSELVLDGTTLYFSTEGAIMKVPVIGGVPETVVTALLPVGLAVDATSVYWAEPLSNSVKKVTPK